AFEDQTDYWRTSDENSWTPLSFAPRRHVVGGKAYTVLYVYVENQSISLYRFFNLFPAKGISHRRSQACFFWLDHLACLSPFPPVERCTSSKTSLDTALTWLRQCSITHESCAGLSPSTSNWLPTRLVDIGLEDDQKWKVLVTKDDVGADVPISYITLSYRWGSRQTTRLSSSNLPSFRAGKPVSLLPLTFRDLFVVARHVGIQYLWIDCLCIIQDSVADWDAEASTMRNIYANAFCNVAATASNDPDGGLFRERDTNSIRPGLVESTLTTGSLERNLIFTSNYWYNRLYRGTLHHRGWVFQECFLAPRLLYFTQDQIMWECGQTHKCEGFVDGVPGHEPSVDQSQKTERTLREWTHLVMQYSECHFTRPEDRLNAFSGVANLFQEATGCRYLAGMWEEELLHQLCWTATEPGPRLSTKYRAPSWSWASIDGAVYIRGPNAKKAIDFFLQIEDVGVMTKDVDQTLNVVDGFLRLNCPFGTARYSQWSETEHLIIQLENGFSPQKMHARWLPDTTNDEKLPRSGIVQLVFCKREAACEGSPEPYFIDCIVVTGTREEDGNFRRAGILRIDEERDVSLANTMLLSNQIERRIITLV
ncbi:heterokaryon incompatibility protein, partial [Colletotrichum asianum]